MDDVVSVIMPAFRCGDTIAAAVRSVLSDPTPLEIVIAVDDGADYRALLAGQGVVDPRLVFTSTGTVGSGASAARNAALDTARGRYAATLDADDAFAPGKLARVMAMVRAHGLVSTGLAVVDEDLAPLRSVAIGPSRLLTPAAYKFTNISMDSMIVWDRARADARYDPGLPCMTDLDFVMRLFATIPACYHIGEPLHLYRKLTRSISNGPGVTARMVAAKTLLRERLAAGLYRFASPDAAPGLDAFLAVSLAAERAYAPDPDAGPALFEDHLDGFLAQRMEADLPAPRSQHYAKMH